MKKRAYLYLILCKILNFFLCKIENFITWVKFYFLCSEFHSFKTTGIPFLSSTIRRPGQIKFGKNLTLNNGMRNIQIGYGKTPCVFRAEGGNITIGDNVGITQTALVAIDADITIGSNTLLGGGTKIYTSDFHPLSYFSRRDESLNVSDRKSAPVTIGEDCFIGSGSIILKGVVIGDRTVVGAGSIVTKSLPSDAICAGNPCRVIKQNDNK